MSHDQATVARSGLAYKTLQAAAHLGPRKQAKKQALLAEQRAARKKERDNAA